MSRSFGGPSFKFTSPASTASLLPITNDPYRHRVPGGPNVSGANYSPGSHYSTASLPVRSLRAFLETIQILNESSNTALDLRKGTALMVPVISSIEHFYSTPSRHRQNHGAPRCS